MNGTAPPLVSLIIPVYNVDRYLDACLDSVSRQSYPNIEVVIVDDGSTDGSAAICDAWSEECRFRTAVYHNDNNGVAAARNFGLDHCHGDFVAFLDSDDVIGPDYVSRLVELMQSVPDADVAMTSFVRGISPENQDWTAGTCVSVISGEAVLCSMLYQVDGTDSAVWGKLFRSDLFDGIRFRDGMLYEDLELLHRLLQRSRGVVKSDAVNYFYRINPSGLTGKLNFNLHRLDVLAVTGEIHDSAKWRPWFKAARDRFFSANCNMYALLCANGMAHSAYADTCWQAIKELRRGSLFDRHTRIKSKAGAAFSYAGRRLFRIISYFTI
ncbi:MAG: glycosyltransferase [Bacteroides sp.]|nr:glycosyltransferase [Bacteroides sp.]MCM1389724.1 glycosyltransferase [Bacteroides sp.]